MIRDSRKTTWPSMGVLFCLLMLSITAPRVWLRASHAWPDVDSDFDATSGQASVSTGPGGPRGEMQRAAPGPKYGRRVVKSDWADLEPLDPVMSSDKRDRPAWGELPDTESPQPDPLGQEVLEPEMPEDNRDMSLVEGVAVLLPEEICLLAPPTDKPGGWSSGSLGWPQALFGQLDALAWDCETGEWARSTAKHVRRLGRAMARGSDDAVWITRRLANLVSEADRLADGLVDAPLASDLREAGRSLGRRTYVWQWVISAGGPAATIAERGPGNPARIERCLAQIDAMLSDSAESTAWRDFLAFDRLKAMTAQADAGPDEQDWTLSVEVLTRLSRPGMTDQQLQFTARGPMATLQSELRDWIGGPVNLGRLMEHIERYEATGSVADARRMSQDLIRLRVSPIVGHREFAHRLQSGYRRANVRIAVTEELLNRMVPQREREYEWMRDQVLGVPVRGHQWTDTDVAIRMVPDSGRLRMALEIEGLVSSLTSSSSGPATFHNDSKSTYKAYKQLELKASGLYSQPARVSVDNSTKLRSVETDLDGVPLIGSLVREIALSEHRKSRPRIKREVKEKVHRRASQQIDNQTEAELGKLNHHLTDRVVEPLRAMSIGPTMVQAHTSPERITMELRLAGEVQLGAHTARPWAPSDSLASCQIHQSALNNVAEGLELDGKTFTLAELRRHVADRFKRPELAAIETENDDVSIKFAQSDAVQLRFEDGRVAIKLSVARMRKGRRAWSDFQVRAYYRPEVNGRSAQLVRDGVVQLLGRHNARSQIALRGIFSSTFAKQRPWPVFPQGLADEPNMAGLCVTQLAFTDGWLGVALGPVRSDPRSTVAQRPSAAVE